MYFPRNIPGFIRTSLITGTLDLIGPQTFPKVEVLYKYGMHLEIGNKIRNLTVLKFVVERQIDTVSVVSLWGRGKKIWLEKVALVFNSIISRSRFHSFYFVDKYRLSNHERAYLTNRRF